MLYGFIISKLSRIVPTYFSLQTSIVTTAFSGSFLRQNLNGLQCHWPTCSPMGTCGMTVGNRLLGAGEQPANLSIKIRTRTKPGCTVISRYCTQLRLHSQNHSHKLSRYGSTVLTLLHMHQTISARYFIKSMPAVLALPLTQSSTLRRYQALIVEFVNYSSLQTATEIRHSIDGLHYYTDHPCSLCWSFNHVLSQCKMLHLEYSGLRSTIRQQVQDIIISI